MRNSRGVLCALAAVACDMGGQALPDGGTDTFGDAASLDALAAFAGTISGYVRSDGVGVADAVVRFGGREETAVTADDGSFELVVEEPAVILLQLALTAGKEGYWNDGITVVDPSASQEIELVAIDLIDNPTYAFKSPDDFDAAPFCRHCHPHQYEPWVESRHSFASKDPLVHDLYNGTATGLGEEDCLAQGGSWRQGKTLGEESSTYKCYVVGGGVLPDLNPGICGGDDEPTCDDPDALDEERPSEVSVCADCHAPASDEHIPGATNLNEVSGVPFAKGVFCDFCHKIANVNVNERPGVNGAIDLVRPGPAISLGWSNPEIMFGPYSDVIIFFMGGTPNAQFRSSELCSACHQWSEPGFRPDDQALVDLDKWPDGLPLTDTYYEWTGSPAGAAGMQCQNCHMPAQEADTATIDLGNEAPMASGTRGWPRAYGEVREHSFLRRQPEAEPDYVQATGDPTRESLREPIDIDVNIEKGADGLTVTVELTNSGAGHSIPTGMPFRQMLLLVDATALGAQLDAIGGYSVPSWAGAYAAGALGTSASSLSGDVLSLPDGEEWPSAVGAGSVVRFVRATGSYDDYPGTRWFGDEERTPLEQGMEIFEPLGEATIVSIDGADAILDSTLVLDDGTLFFVGAPLPDESIAVDDELELSPFAGAPGYAFAKVMLDRDGLIDVPFFRAIDIASDNRIPAGATATTTHLFEAPPDGTEVAVTVTLLYRPQPYGLATERGWTDVSDEVRLQELVAAVP